MIYQIRKKLRELSIRLLNLFKPDESIIDAKSKWNALARKNARYYVLTDKGESISEEDFRSAGERDVKKYFLDDEQIGRIVNSSKAKVLEVGCGIGRLSEFISPHVDHLYGVDISEEMIYQAKRRLEHLSNVSFFASDGYTYPVEDGLVDIVFSFIVFQHMPSYEIIRKNIEEISRVLKKGGLAKIQLRGIPVSKDSWYYGPSFSHNRFEELIKDIPLKIIKTEGEGEKYFWIWLQKKHD